MRSKSTWGPWILTLGLLVAWATPAFAQQKDAWGPLTPGQEETLPAAPLLYAAYAFVWAAVVVYLSILWSRIGRVERELADVNARLAAKPARR